MRASTAGIGRDKVTGQAVGAFGILTPMGMRDIQMRHRWTQWLNAVVIAVVGLTLAGCNTLSDARGARGTGTAEVFDSGFERVWDVVPRAANDCDLTVAGAYKAEKYILAERGATMVSWGERVAIFVEPRTPTSTSVEVVSKRAVAMNITATDFEKRLLNRIRELLH